MLRLWYRGLQSSFRSGKDAKASCSSEIMRVDQPRRTRQEHVVLDIVLEKREYIANEVDRRRTNRNCSADHSTTDNRSLWKQLSVYEVQKFAQRLYSTVRLDTCIRIGTSCKGEEGRLRSEA